MKIKVFKFGGASVKNAEAVRNMGDILEGYLLQKEKLLIVVSAMGKMTNAFEQLLLNEYKSANYELGLQEIKDFHSQIVKELFEDEQNSIFQRLKRLFFDLEQNLAHQFDNYDEKYDQIISFGELISTHILAQYLKQRFGNCLWIDARKYIQTNQNWREAQVDWAWSEQIIKKELLPLLENNFLITQGFIGGTVTGKTTTLGREGSDFSAAIFAYCLPAQSMSIWKDVDGILNQDPRESPNGELFEKISYQDAAEMTYYGASVIHSKTIRPLAQKNIPLYVRSFKNPEKEGTTICNGVTQPIIPATIIKKNQILICFKHLKLDFIKAADLSTIFYHLEKLTIKLNLVQNTATTFAICTDFDSNKLAKLIHILNNKFEITSKQNLKLITIKNYNQETLSYYQKIKNRVIWQQTTTNLHCLFNDLKS